MWSIFSASGNKVVEGDGQNIDRNLRRGMSGLNWSTILFRLRERLFPPLTLLSSSEYLLHCIDQ